MSNTPKQTGRGIEIPDSYITIISQKGKDKPFVLFPGLISLGHKTAKSLDGRLSQTHNSIVCLPSSENDNTCVVECAYSIVDEKTGLTLETHYGIGDASPKSCNKMIVPHIIRMAATRAKARALRVLTDVGLTAFEELGDIKGDVDYESYSERFPGTASKNITKSTTVKKEVESNPVKKEDDISKKVDNDKKKIKKEITDYCKANGIDGKDAKKGIENFLGKTIKTMDSMPLSDLFKISDLIKEEKFKNILSIPEPEKKDDLPEALKEPANDKKELLESIKSMYKKVPKFNTPDGKGDTNFKEFILWVIGEQDKKRKFKLAELEMEQLEMLNTRLKNLT